MNKTTNWLHILLRSALRLTLAMFPVLALAANPYAGADSPALPEASEGAAANAQTLDQKPDVYLQLIAGMQERGLYYASLTLGKFEEARLALFKAAELDDGNKRIGANLALLMVLSGKPEQAQELMQRYNLAPRVREEILARAADARTGQNASKEAVQ